MLHGLFGPVAPGLERRIGDLLVLSAPGRCVVDSRRHRPDLIALIGLHGSLTTDETLVPVVHLQGTRCRLGCAVVAELVFFSGTMDCGKSTLALQMGHNHSARGRIGLIFTKFDRMGESVLSSRLGLSMTAIEVTDDLDFWEHIIVL